ncbi:dihydrolipoamide acetyltransferase family protein [Paenibacillus marinisediminis]
MSTNTRSNDVVMPQLAESLVNATIGKWLKQPGDYVDAYEPICEVITEKVVAELPSTESGVMLELIAKEGETVAVGAVICRIGSEVELNSAPTGATPTGIAAQPAHGGSAAPQDNAMRDRYSPAVQRLAQEHQVNLNEVTGTGLGGRITRKDVRDFIEKNQSAPQQVSPSAAERSAAPSTMQYNPPSEAARTLISLAEEETKHVPVRNSGLHLSETPRVPKIEVQGEGLYGRGETLIDVTPIRNTIATKMRQSVTEIPHGWTMIEVDVTNLVLLRSKLKDEFKRKEGVNLTYLAFVLKAVVNAIKDYPIMNSVWAVDKIIVKRDINISLAVGTEDSVLTPVIKNADQKNVAGLAFEIEDLARKVRERKLKIDEMQGGTFTVNNTGSFGSILSYPIINYPQAAMMTFESIVKKPVVIHDMIAVRSMANICLSLDHRILDGVICGRFLQRVKENLESFNLESKLY